MAWYDDWSNEEFFEDTGVNTPDVNEILFGGPGIEDTRAQELFVQAFFEDNDKAYVDLVDYMWNEYHMDFEEAFEWEDFREWYDSQ